MPPIGQVRHNNHGEFRYGPAISRNLIAVQTLENLAEITGAGVWGFNATEGLGVAVAAGETKWYFPGDLRRQYMLSEWKYVTAAAGRYMGMVARGSAPGAGSIGYYLLGLKNNNAIDIVNVTGGGDAIAATVGITDAVELGEIFRLQAWISTNYDANAQDIIFEHLSRGRVSNTPGAAAYNLAAVGDPCFLAVKIDSGVVQNISFASGDAIVIANGGLGALTNVGLAAVINSQIAGGYAISIPPAATYVVIYTNIWSTSGSVDVDAYIGADANTVLNFPLAASTGHTDQVRVSNNSRLRGFSGLIGGHGGNTAQWTRSFSVSGF